MHKDPDINSILVELMLDRIPKKSKLVEELSDILAIDKRAVYRRINNETSFTLSEALTISSTFDIPLSSIDRREDTELFKSINLMDIFSATNTPASTSNIREMFSKIETIIQLPGNEHREICNFLPTPLQMKYPYLGVSYLLYVALRTGKRLTFDSFIPKDMDDYAKRANETILGEQSYEYTLYIFGFSMFSSTVKCLQYMEGLRMISPEHMRIIKEELYAALADLENATLTGRFDITGNKCDIYISDIDVESNYGYFTAGNRYVSVFRSFVFNLLVSYDKKIFRRMHDSIESLKKTSTLISGTSEIKRVEFFERQNEIIDSLI